MFQLYYLFFPEDPQQLERKRHIGNDIVMILFRESTCQTPFSPMLIHSQYNHIFIVIQKEKPYPGNSMTYYRVSVSAKLGVQPFGPKICNSGLFPKTPLFRQFLLTKCINGERAALYAPDFRQAISLTRKQTLHAMIEQFDLKDKKKRFLGRKIV